MDYTEEDAPLDPVMERVRRKMIRLMVISIGIMMIGLLAVLFAIVYKISSPSDSGNDASNSSSTLPSETIVELAPGSKIESSTVSANHLVIQVSNSDGTSEYLIIDLESGKLLRQVNIKTEK